jgi:hypothetical protein
LAVKSIRKSERTKIRGIFALGLDIKVIAIHRQRKDKISAG